MAPRVIKNYIFVFFSSHSTTSSSPFSLSSLEIKLLRQKHNRSLYFWLSPSPFLPNKNLDDDNIAGRNASQHLMYAFAEANGMAEIKILIYNKNFTIHTFGLIS
jgi:hypothetical protein